MEVVHASQDLVQYNPPITIEVGKEYTVTTSYGYKTVRVDKIYQDSSGDLVVMYSWPADSRRKSWFGQKREWTRVKASTFKTDVMMGGVNKLTI